MPGILQTGTQRGPESVHVAGGLHVWRFTPVARPDDPAWQGRTVWEDFRIVAPNAGAAILLASRYDEELKGLSVSGSQDRQQLASGLEDARLYRVDVCEDDPVVGPAGTVVMALRAGQSRGLANELPRQERKN